MTHRVLKSHSKMSIIYIFIYIRIDEMNLFFLRTDTNLGKVNVNLIIIGRSKMGKTFYIMRLKNQVYLTNGLMN